MGDDNLLKFPVYKCGEINISTHDSVKITVESEPIVLWKDFVTVERDGELVGTISLERGGYPVSLSVLLTHDFTNIVFGSYTLITGPNELVASLYNGAGTLVDRISITVHIE